MACIALGSLCAETGRRAEANQLLDAAVQISRQIGDRASEGVAIGNLARGELEVGRRAAARARIVEALAIHRASGTSGRRGGSSRTSAC